MATEAQAARSVVERDVGAGGEELISEPEKGVRVRKTGGVEFASPLSQAQIDLRHTEISSQIEHQRAIITRAREESLNQSRQANEQEILAREALELKDFNRKREVEAAREARELATQVNQLLEKEKQLEHQRAEAHHLAVEKEKLRVEAKTAEVMAREEAFEAEKREQYHKELIRNCQALNMKYKLEEEQAKLKLESLQYTLQYGDFRPAAASRAQIIVEVQPRSLPEARQFDTEQVEKKVALAEIVEENVPPMRETRTVEEMVTAERSSKLRSSQTSATSYGSRHGGLRAEEIRSTSESQMESESFVGGGSLREEKPAMYESGGVYQQSIPPAPPLPGSDQIKVLPDIKPQPYSESAFAHGAGGGAPQSQFIGSQQQVGSGYGQQMGGVSETLPNVPAQPSQPFPSSSYQQQPPQYSMPSHQVGTSSNVPEGIATEQVASEASRAAGKTSAKKEKSGGFFKKFKSKPPTTHEQH